MIDTTLIKQSIRSNAKHISIRVNHKGEIIITSPYQLSKRKFNTIIKEHNTWIENQLVQYYERNTLTTPHHIFLSAIDKHWDIQYQCTTTRPKLIPLNDQSIVIYGLEDKNLIKKLLIKWLSEQAKLHLYPWFSATSQRIGLSYSSLSMGQHRSQWGSCSKDKRICLNAKLLFLPPNLVEHVFIHELAHTVYFDHSKAFWHLVASHDKYWQSHKKALKFADDFLPEWLR